MKITIDDIIWCSLIICSCLLLCCCNPKAVRERNQQYMLHDYKNYIANDKTLSDREKRTKTNEVLTYEYSQ